MDLLPVLTETIRHWIQNISILVLLLLLYNFIPNDIYHKKDFPFKILVGLIFCLAAVMGILVPWTGTAEPEIGFNGVLIPLAGYIGGLVSAGIITLFLLLFRISTEGNIGITPDVVIALIAMLVGSGFHTLRKWRPDISRVHTLLILSLLFAGITVMVLSLYSQSRVHPSLPLGVQDTELGCIIFFGLFIIGMVILQIDRKKEGECELKRYQQDLENIVLERTSELARINALQQATLESTSDGIVVVDLAGRVTGYNQVAATLLDIRSPGEVQEESLDILHLLRYHVTDPSTVDRALLAVHPDEIPVLNSDMVFRSGRIYEFSVTPYLLNQEMLGRVLTFRDITEKKQAEEQLRNMNQKLLLLSGITRHDILNQITALKLYVYLVRNDPADPQVMEYLTRMAQTLRLMQQHTEESGDYQDVGIHEPIWQNPNTVFNQAGSPLSDRGITVVSETIPYEILADPLIERVFYNLIDNSVRHGDHVTRISLSAERKKDTLVLIYEDNGSGVDPADKDRIFQKGFGKHTGFGMFLVQEIISITGITIRENGIFGSGARFEILIPSGAFRPVS